MYKNNLGYIFECKKDNRGNIGIKESFNFSYKGDIQRVSAIFGVDINGAVICPAYFDKALGIVPLRSLVSPDTIDADIEKFVRSNRATYSLSATTYLICSIEAKISRSTHQWIPEDLKISFYVPKGSSSLGKLMNSNSEEWGIVCDIAATSGKLNTFQVSEGILNGYKQLVLSQLCNIVTDDKKAYIKGRVAKYL